MTDYVSHHDRLRQNKGEPTTAPVPAERRRSAEPRAVAPPKRFPIGVFFFDAPFATDYASIGINTLVGGNHINDPAYLNAITTSGVDWWLAIEWQSMIVESITPIAEDPALASLVKGYFLGDEPDLVTLDGVGWRSPQFFRDLKAAVRRLDSTRPTMLNLGKWPPMNMAFAWLPPGATSAQVNAYWRDYASIFDVLSCDFYNITSDQNNGIFGIWTYPRITRRMMDLNDGRTPVWGYVESTSQVPNEPTPDQVYRACWAHLIEGATGLVFFDHRFPDSDVSLDFAALLHNAPMRSMVQSICSLTQQLADALFAPDAGLITAVSSSNKTAGPYGGTIGVPLHYTSRAVGDATYVFAMSIRPGTTTGTFTAPSLAGQTLTVIGESRTVTVNGSGVFSDSFASDYEVHLYTTDALVLSAPVNTSAPVVSTDGTPQTGETVNCSTGSWSGIPTPTFGYQWQRNPGTGFANISASANAYVLQVADEGTSVRCRVTGTNNQGSSTANSNSITPASSGGGGGGPSLPAGVTLQAIDGGPTYYADNGFTYAEAAGWDDPSFFPIGVWYGSFGNGMADINRWHDLKMNTSFAAISPTDVSILRDNGIWLVSQSAYPNALPENANIGSETVGVFLADEPETMSTLLYGIINTPDAVQNGRFWWQNNTWNFIGHGGINPISSSVDVLNTTATTPGGATRSIDIPSTDLYWFGNAAGGNTNELNVIYGISNGTNPGMTSRGHHYGMMVDRLRAFQTPAGNAPILQFVENGGPYIEHTSIDTYIMPEELNWAVWSSIIHGARMIAYFNHTFSGPASGVQDNLASSFYQTPQNGRSISIYDQTKATNTLIEQLAPVIHSPKANGYVTTSPAPSDFAGIEARACYYASENAFYIFSATHLLRTTTNIAATFTVAGGYSGPVTVINEGRTVTATAGVFTDTFASASTIHIYKVPNA